MKHFSFFYLVLGVFVSLFPPIVLHLLLNAEGPLYLVLSYLIVLHVLGFFYNIEKSKVKFVLTLLKISLIFGAVVLLIQILINPYSAYVVWFQLIDEGKPRGSISFIFVSFTAYFLLLSTIGIHGNKVIQSLLTSLLILLLTWFLIVQNPSVLIIFLVSLVLFVVFTIAKRYNNTYRFQWGIVSVIVLMTMVGAISLLLSSVVVPKGSRLVDASLSPVLRRAVVELFPRFPLLYRVPGYGSRISEKDLGGSPILTERPVFKIGPFEEDLYLRTSVYTTFNGRSWSNEAEEGQVEEAKKEPSIEFVTNPEYVFSLKKQIQLEVLTEYYSMLPHTLETEIVYCIEPISISSGTRSTGYILEKPLLRGQTIMLGEDSGMKSKKVEEDLSPYLKIPRDISEDITVLAEELKRDSKRETVSAIGDFLASGEFQYTLHPKKAKREISFLDSFLFYQREGFCTHFATAFIILARYNGIPARYATGFYVSSRRADEVFETAPSTVVTGYSAHAWPEVNIPGLGWVAYEVTPPMRPEHYDDPDFWNSFFTEAKTYTKRQIEAILGIEAPKKKSDGTAKSPLSGRIVFMIFLLLIVSALFLFGFLILRLGRSSQKGRTDKDVLKLQRIGRRMSKVAGKKGVAPPEVSGWLEWEKNTQKIVHKAEMEAENGAELSIFRRTFFGRYTPTEEDISKIDHLRKQIRRASRRME